MYIDDIISSVVSSTHGFSFAMLIDDVRTGERDASVESRVLGLDACVVVNRLSALVAKIVEILLR
jgi:hypothetical protein